MKRVYFLLLLILFITPLFAEENEEAFPYLTRDRYKALCRYFYDDYGLQINPKGREDCWCVTTDYVNIFFNKYAPKDKPFTLFTVNSDISVDARFKSYYNYPMLRAWYGQNISYKHPKLKSLPIGLCNWANLETFQRVQKNLPPKTRLVYANYKVGNNMKERQHCMSATGIPSEEPNKPYEQFLNDMASSYFVISPNGNGVDCHRHWEALYLRSVPIVTRSMNIENYKDLPILILDDWDDFKDLELTPELYESIMGDFDPSVLTVEHFLPSDY